ncbi:hypothetical protein [Endozoicomonas elysicola]|uniref:Uncharacterized protein n=1 Tax=Endozoicomonas elysicola TaxID=305900 RepID=A0A081KF45_9GAMM|nr:hypothetical protein [Endozoicomonas elysicola]KEI72771.1 hypothetical protein GV64_20380 [Endozoicomonas elysicola]
MKKLFIITLLISPHLTQAELLTCDQKQAVCEAQCKASSLISEQDSNTCKAQCLGERAACELDQGKASAEKLAEQAKGASQSFMDKLKAFWNGLRSNL